MNRWTIYCTSDLTEELKVLETSTKQHFNHQLQKSRNSMKRL